MRGAYETIGQRFRDELGFVPRLGVNHAGVIRAAELPAEVGIANSGIREIGPHFHFDQFERRDGTGTESRYFDWHVVLMMNDSGFFESGVNRNRRGNVTPFMLNGARGVRIGRASTISTSTSPCIARTTPPASRYEAPLFGRRSLRRPSPRLRDRADACG